MSVNSYYSWERGHPVRNERRRCEQLMSERFAPRTGCPRSQQIKRAASQTWRLAALQRFSRRSSPNKLRWPLLDKGRDAFLKIFRLS